MVFEGRAFVNTLASYQLLATLLRRDGAPCAVQAFEDGAPNRERSCTSARTTVRLSAQAFAPVYPQHATGG